MRFEQPHNNKPFKQEKKTLVIVKEEKTNWGERGSNSRPQDNSEAMRPTR